jgi:hypothetical protein
MHLSGYKLKFEIIITILLTLIGLALIVKFLHVDNPYFGILLSIVIVVAIAATHRLVTGKNVLSR